MVEVFTVGGGEYLVTVFNAVAAWTGQGGYKSLIQVALVMGFAMACVTIAFNNDWRAWINWFLQATLIYMCLMVPRVDVHVTDRVNPTLAPADIANVPLGLGLMASFTSQVGDYLVRTAEVVFGMPNDVNYSKNGMVYGSRLMEATQAVQINDPEFSANLDEHMKQCVFYDILLGLKSMTQLSNAPDLWAAIGTNASPARAQKYLTRNPDGTVTSSILTCRDAWNDMNNRWTATGGILDGVMAPLAKQLYPKLTDAVARAKFAADVPTAYSYLTGVSSSASSILKQNLLINAMQQSMHTQAGATGVGSVDVYAATRADLQTRNTYSAISHNAMKWVPLLHIVLTTLFYALFPVLFPLFLVPRTGIPALKGYVTGFFYLAAWGPIFVILHMIMMLKASADMTAIGGGTGLSLASAAGIAGVNDDVGLLAGYLIASVPFLAAGVAKGAMAMSGHATSFLAPSQNAAEAAALEGTTGNLSLGNSSFDNQTISTRQQGMWTTAASYTGGASAFSTRQADGTVTTQFPGSTVVDAGGSMSRLPFTPQLSNELQSAFTKNAEDSFSRAHTLSNSASQSFSTAQTQATELRHQLTSGNTLERSYGTNDQEVIRSGLSEVDKAAAVISARTGLDMGVAKDIAFQTRVGGELGISGRLGTPGGGGSGGGGLSPVSIGLNGNITGGASKSWTDSQRVGSSFQLSQARDLARDIAASQGWDHTREGFNRAVSNSTSGNLNSLANSTTSSYTQAATFARESRTSYEQGQRFTDAASLRDSHGVSLSENLTQPFVNFVLGEQARTPWAPHAWNPTQGQAITQEQVAERDFYIDRFIHAEEEKIRAGVESSLVKPTPAGIERPSVSSQAGIRKMAAGGAAHLNAQGVPDTGAPSQQDVDDARAGVSADYVTGRGGARGELNQNIREVAPLRDHIKFADPQATFDRNKPD